MSITPSTTAAATAISAGLDKFGVRRSNRIPDASAANSMDQVTPKQIAQNDIRPFQSSDEEADTSDGVTRDPAAGLDISPSKFSAIRRISEDYEPLTAGTSHCSSCGSFPVSAALAGRCFMKSFMQKKLYIRLIPDPLVFGQLPSRGYILGGQPDGYRLKFLFAFRVSDYISEGESLALAHGETQVCFDLDPVFLPPSRFVLLVSKGRNDESSRRRLGSLPATYSFFVRFSASSRL